MTKATLVSVMPFQFRDSKPTVYPSYVEIPKVDLPYDKFAIAVIPDAVTYVFLDADRGYMKRIILSDELAESLVEDFLGGIVYADFDVRPGFFWVPNELTEKQVQEQCVDKLKDARKKQEDWFLRIVKIADDDWANSHHHRSISPLQKEAAAQLGLEREWVIQSNRQTEVEFMKCPYCRILIDKESTVCSSCRNVINAKQFTELQKVINAQNAPVTKTA